MSRAAHDDCAALTVLRVPKTASTSLLNFINVHSARWHNHTTTNSTSSNPCLVPHDRRSQWVRVVGSTFRLRPEYSHRRLAGRCTVATLRHPCDRIISIFAHLVWAYTLHGECAAPSLRCRQHWVHAARGDVSRFVGVLRDHWASVSTQDKYESALEAHQMVALPQHRWVVRPVANSSAHGITDGALVSRGERGRTWSKDSRVLCWSRLDSDVRSLLRSVGCPPEAAAALPPVSRAMSRTPSQAAVAAQFRAVATSRTSTGATTLNLTLTNAACDDVKVLYEMDARLHREHCGPHAMWDHSEGVGNL